MSKLDAITGLNGLSTLLTFCAAVTGIYVATLIAAIVMMRSDKDA